MGRTAGRQPGFSGFTGVLLAALVVWNLSFQLASELLGSASWKPLELPYSLPGWVGLFLPFAVLAGAMATHHGISYGALFARAGLIAGISYVLMAVASPSAIYRMNVSAGVDAASLYPFGPQTPGAMFSQRAAVEENPPGEFSFRIDEPLQWPPNWLTYLLHSVIAISGFSLLAAFIGYRIGGLTTGLSPPRRWNTRLGLGLITGLAFFLAESAGGDWVRASPSNSGVLGAWVPLLVPVLELAILEALAHARVRTRVSRA